MDVRGSRPGGRSQRVRRAVFDATWACLDEGLAQVTLAEVASRASVAPSSLYRRWGTAANLMAEVLLEESDTAISVPDTGEIRGDLIAFAENVARFLTSSRGVAVLRATASIEWSEEFAAARERYWDERFTLGGVMIHRAVDRGELDPGIDARVLLEMVVAPLHLRHLLLGDDPTSKIAEQVDLLLTGSRRTS